MELQIGQKVVYGIRGICEIAKLTEKWVVLKSLKNEGMVILALRSELDRGPIAPVPSTSIAAKVLEQLRDGELPEFVSGSWNQTYRAYLEALRSNDYLEIAKVYQVLEYLNNSDGLSFGERNLLDCAKERLELELGIDLSSLNHKLVS